MATAARHSPSSATRIAELLAAPRFEVIPVRGIDERLAVLPAGSHVTVTASPAFGLGRTVDVAVRLAASGFDVVPHLAAHMVSGRGELAGMVERLAAAGVREAFVVGGDATPAGPYADAGDLLDELAGLEHPFARIGIGGYPEGHPLAADDLLLEALRRKQPYADYIVTQLCFDAAALVSWVERMRAAGISLPVIAGVAGPVERRRLAEIALKTGVGTSMRYLRKHGRQLVKLARSRHYDPLPLLRAIVVAEQERGLALQGLHLFTFNQLEATAGWARDRAAS
jgi:methylenetetrahydrofolate reductase (NADPH)